MSLRVAINGFGRIGKSFLRAVCDDPEASKKIEVVAINQGPCAIPFLGHFFKYDTVMPTYQGVVRCNDNFLEIDAYNIQLFSESCPENINWKDLAIDWVIESSGCFTSHQAASAHCLAGAKKVLITAPSNDADITIVPGVNDQDYDPGKHHLVSLGSCTTNCFVPLVKVIKEEFRLLNGLMTTVHAYTNSQAVVDSAHTDPRTGRAAGENIIPTKTGADKVITTIFPDLKGKIKAIAVRVPVPVVSLVDFTFNTHEELTPLIINNAFKKASQGPMKKVLHWSDEPLVSSDFIGNSYSTIFDSLLTQSLGTMHKVFAWYDNEYGYSVRLKDFLLHNS